MSMKSQKEKQELGLGLSEWHRVGPREGDRSSVYVDLYPTRDRGTQVNQEVLLVGQDMNGSMSFVDMNADDAEMLGMRLIAAARMYREQEREEADDE